MAVIRFHPEAERELLAAAEWYEREREGLGTEFLGEVGRILTSLAESPAIWPVWRGVEKSLPLRRALLSRFPYAVAYESGDAATTVYAVAHLARRPGYWRDRLRK